MANPQHIRERRRVRRQNARARRSGRHVTGHDGVARSGERTVGVTYHAGVAHAERAAGAVTRDCAPLRRHATSLDRLRDRAARDARRAADSRRAGIQRAARDDVRRSGRAAARVSPVARRAGVTMAARSAAGQGIRADQSRSPRGEAHNAYLTAAVSLAMSADAARMYLACAASAAIVDVRGADLWRRAEHASLATDAVALRRAVRRRYRLVRDRAALARASSVDRGPLPSTLLRPAS